MIIRKLTGEDYPAVLPLYEELDRMHFDARPDCCLPREVAYPKNDYDEVIAAPDCLMIGAFDESGNLLGTVRATLWNKSGMVEGIKTVCLDDIYVLPEARRKGIARELFAYTEFWAKEQGAVRLDLHVWGFNKDALSLYRAMGMTPQRYVMEKNL